MTALTIPPDRYRESIRADADAFTVAVAAAPQAPVAACPEWDTTALMEHVGDVFAFATAQLRAASTDMARPDLSAKSDPGTWFAAATETLLDTLAVTDPGAPAWNWAAVPTASFWFRRMAAEMAVHRYDAQDAANHEPEPVAADIATDAIDELIEVGMQHRVRGPNHDFPAGSLHLHRTDGDGEWLLRVDDGALVVTHEHAKGDVAARGSASDLLLWLWGRGRGQLEIFGDDELAAAWAAVAP